MTPFQQHTQKWRDCTACPLHIGRTRVVFCRGKIPCDILFVGEAPGKTEDMHGQPFYGPAGGLLDDIIKHALWSFVNIELRLAFTNLVACLCLGEDNKAEPPNAVSVQACAPRLSEFVRIVQPKLIVCVGGQADKWLNQPRLLRKSHDINPRIPRVSIVHPSSMLAMNDAMKTHNRRKAITVIAKAVEKYLVLGEKVPVDLPLTDDLPLTGYDDEIPF